MKYITLLILLFSISINSQEVQQVEVVKNDNQISELFEELGQNEIKLEKNPDILEFLGKNNRYKPKLLVGFSADYFGLTFNVQLLCFIWFINTALFLVTVRNQ